jgi:hypothetical protein
MAEALRQEENEDILEKETIIESFCAKCKKLMGTKPGNGISGASHGYCPECQAEIMKEIKDIKEKKLREKQGLN